MVKQLQDQFHPCDSTSLAHERMALNYANMKNHEESKRLFERIKAVETRFNTKTNKMTEADKIAVVLSQSPVAFQSVLTNESRTMKGQNKVLTMKDL